MSLPCPTIWDTTIAVCPRCGGCPSCHSTDKDERFIVVCQTGLDERDTRCEDEWHETP